MRTIRLELKEFQDLSNYQHYKLFYKVYPALYDTLEEIGININFLCPAHVSFGDQADVLKIFKLLSESAPLGGIHNFQTIFADLEQNSLNDDNTEYIIDCYRDVVTNIIPNYINLYINNNRKYFLTANEQFDMDEFNNYADNIIKSI